MQLLAETIRPQGGPADLDVEVRDQVLMGGIATLIARRLNAGEAGAPPRASPRPHRARPRPYMGRAEARRFALEAAV